MRRLQSEVVLKRWSLCRACRLSRTHAGFDVSRGAVGSIACQIALIAGCKVVAIAGGKDKCDWLKNDIGCHEVVDYKSADFAKTLKQTLKNGVDAYFDNVGGEILDLVLTRLNKGARIALCGAIS